MCVNIQSVLIDVHTATHIKASTTNSLVVRAADQNPLGSWDRTQLRGHSGLEIQPWPCWLPGWLPPNPERLFPPRKATTKLSVRFKSYFAQATPDPHQVDEIADQPGECWNNNHNDNNNTNINNTIILILTMIILMIRILMISITIKGGGKGPWK